jgi:subtilisin family serine protease
VIARLLTCCVAVLVVVGLAPAAAAAPPPVTERVIVQLRPGADAPGVATAQERTGADVRRVYRHVLNGFAAELPAAAVAALRRDPQVLSVTADVPVHATTTQPNPPWGLDRIDQRTGMDGSYSYDTTGAGVTVFLVDSGVRLTHTQFGGRAISGYDFVDDDTNASDCNGHGTHVAGTLGGSTYGVAKGVRIVSLRVFDCSGNGFTSDVIAAFDWAVGHKTGPSVINYSGGGAANSATDDAVARTTAAGIPTVVAAGNESNDACTRSPARAPAAITVAASDTTDVAAFFSNYGSCVDLFAPGVGVLSSWSSSDTATRYLDGTSMATPHVTGAVARYLQLNPTATAGQVAAAIAGSASRDAVVDPLTSNNDLLFVAPPAALAASVEESAATYTGWQVFTDPSANGGTWRTSGTAGTTATFTFSGTGVTWISREGPRQGIARVTIDGVARGTFDLYSATGQGFAQAFTGLSGTRQHTLVITVTGRRNAAAQAMGVIVDAFVVGGVTTQESAQHVKYGTWKGGASPNASGGLYRSSGTAGATATFTFTGTGVDWVTTTGRGWGRAQVLIDGVSRGTVDLYATTARWQTLRSYAGLSPGTHTITIRVLGTKNARATSTNVAIDGFVVH